jgi:hypothetical protein
MLKRYNATKTKLVNALGVDCLFMEEFFPSPDGDL